VSRPGSAVRRRPAKVVEELVGLEGLLLTVTVHQSGKEPRLRFLLLRRWRKVAREMAVEVALDLLRAEVVAVAGFLCNLLADGRARELVLPLDLLELLGAGTLRHLCRYEARLELRRIEIEAATARARRCGGDLQGARGGVTWRWSSRR